MQLNLSSYLFQSCHEKNARLFFLCLFFMIVCATRSHAQANNFDYRILRSIAETRTPEKNDFFKFISKYNNPVCLAAPATLFITGLIKDDVQMKKSSLYVTESIASASLFNVILKKIFKRKRPFINDPTFTAVVYARNESFPSGHTAEAFSMASSMTFAYPRWYVILPTFGWAALVGYSRMYLGVHYPTDVFAGATISSGMSWLLYNANKNYLRK
ncbi:MAG TPA: phosphatase PAP2 family protein [Chitinophagaceae bacterium]|nr:phosphatase PAP2 family protein [Chitinophagaceae bacterium]